MEQGNYRDVFERLLTATRSRSDADLARKLGIKPQSVFQAKKKQAIPAQWLLDVARKNGISVDWMISGRGHMFRDAESLSPDLQDCIKAKEARIQELEEQLAAAKDQALEAYKLAVEAMRPATKVIQDHTEHAYAIPVQDSAAALNDGSKADE